MPAIHSGDLSHSRKTRSSFTGTRVFWFRLWVIPEPSVPFPLDKGNRGSENEIYDPCSYEHLDRRDLCDSSAVLQQLSYQANWEMVVKWVAHKPVEDGYLCI